MARARFPLADYIDDRASLPHHLSASGMRGELRSLRRALRNAPPASEEELVGLVAEAHRVEPDRIFLTHGASEGDALVLLHLGRALRRRLGRRPRVSIPRPEYPPIRDLAVFAGMTVTETVDGADLAARSDPNNPTGRATPRAGTETGPPITVVDETFRAFSAARSGAALGLPGRWTIGTLTKAYGADDVRFGFVLAPPEDAEGFGRTAGLLTDQVGASSRAEAAAVLRARDPILREARGIFRSNLRTLRRRVPGVPALDAPIWFDRPGGKLSGRRLARAAEQAGVLVIPGEFFGDPTGVRVCLTRRSFPRDLDAYLAVRARALAGATGRKAAR